MRKSGQPNNVSWGDRFRAAFKPRDIFLHDGRSLRRFTIGRKLQVTVASAGMALVGWSGFATAQFAVSMTSDVAHMQRQVAEMQADVEAIRQEASEHAQVLEQRQAFLQSILSGEADPNQVARMLPAAGATHDPEAEQQVAQSYSEVEGMQLMLAQQAHQATRARLHQTAAVVRQLGIDPRRFVQGGVGGPFEEVTPGGDAVDPRFAELFATWRQLDQLEQGVASIPSIMPVQGARWTSGFGTRSDPFRGRAAMHAGIDLAGPIGTPIYATADGVVGRSEWSGGYGNLVELQHGSGIATRYGHLSSRVVQAGERVRRGQLIGLMGSTGRSTGSHLHYEVRLDGRAINPLPFLQSGEALAALRQPRGAQGGGAQGGGR
jgi:murein DD-endopeptidase MepM/ murein hydrolase activator NlpD